MQPTVVKRDRTLIAIVSVILVIVVIAVVVVFTRGDPAEVDRATPEGVVQSYTQAIIAGDRSSALDLLTSDVRDNCDRAEPYMIEELRMTVVSTKTSDDTSTVRVSLLHGSGSGIFGGASDESDATFSLSKNVDGQWRIMSTPWPLMICFNQESSP